MKLSLTPWLRFPFLACLAGPLLAPLALHAAPQSTTLSVNDRGQQRTFTIATDEIGIIGKGGAGKVEAVAGAGSVATLRQLATQRATARAAAGEKIDLVVYEAGQPRTAANRRWLTRRVLARLAPGTDAAAVATAVGAAGYDSPSYAPGSVIFTAASGAGAALDLASALRAQAGVLTAEPMLASLANKRFTPNDPLFAYDPANPGYQWHLNNVGIDGVVQPPLPAPPIVGPPGLAGVDVHITGVWDLWRGEDMYIGIIDDGVQLSHPDLHDHLDTSIDFDYNGLDEDPSPEGTEDNHGTAVAGVAAAIGNNGIGGTGAAPEATLVALRLTGGPKTDSDEAGAFSLHNDIIQVKNNSWGPADSGISIEGPGPLATAAIQDAVVNGRQGLGTVFVWAAGNGRVDGDNSNFDGYANSLYTIAVGAIDDDGKQSEYSESGTNLLVCAPSDSNDQHQGITTTDRTGVDGYNTDRTNSFGSANYNSLAYTNDFGGTSSSAPLVSGIVALILQSKPQLGWRDVQEILVRSAAKNDPTDTDWVDNGAGFHFNHKYGAGMVDAGAAVALASTWTNLPPQTYQRKTQFNINAAIPDNLVYGTQRTFSFAADEDIRIEKATVEVQIDHPRRGTLKISLTSPWGSTDQLAPLRPDDQNPNIYWTFSTTRHWGEHARNGNNGSWQLTVVDEDGGAAPGVGDGFTGTLKFAALTLYGSSATSVTAPEIVSPLTASVAADCQFSYQIIAGKAPTSFASPNLPAGLSINTTTGYITGALSTPGTYNVTIQAANASGTTSATLVLTVTASTGATIATAVDYSASPVAADCAKPWTLVADTGGAGVISHDRVDAARSPVLGNGESSAFSITVQGPRVIEFWWKVSSQPNSPTTGVDGDQLGVFVDGEVFNAISGTVNWTRQRVYVPAANKPAVVKWQYTKDFDLSSGTDAGWVDQVVTYELNAAPPVITLQPEKSATNLGGLAVFTVAAEGTPALTYQWQRNGFDIVESSTVIGTKTPRLTFTSVTNAQTGTYTCIVSNAIGTKLNGGAETSKPAALSATTAIADLANALDTNNTTIFPSYVGWIAFNTPTSLPTWTRITTPADRTADGIDSAKAGTIQDGESSYMSTKIIGPGKISYSWAADCEADNDYLEFSLNGESRSRISGFFGGFVTESWTLDAGLNLIEFEYNKNGSISLGADTAWVDKFTYTPAPYLTWIQGFYTGIAASLNTSVTGVEVDPDFDGVANLTEYAFGMTPNKPDAGLAGYSVQADGTNLSFTYKRRKNDTTLVYDIEEWQADDEIWLPVTPESTTVVSTATTTETVMAVLTGSTDLRRIFRLRISLVP